MTEYKYEHWTSTRGSTFDDAKQQNVQHQHKTKDKLTFTATHRSVLELEEVNTHRSLASLISPKALKVKSVGLHHVDSVDDRSVPSLKSLGAEPTLFARSGVDPVKDNAAALNDSQLGDSNQLRAEEVAAMHLRGIAAKGVQLS